MNKSARKLMFNFLISVVFAVLASLVLLLIPLNSGGERNVLLILTGAFFWLFFIISQVSFWQANNVRKTILKCSKKRKVRKPDDSLGIISFCKNKPFRFVRTVKTGVWPVSHSSFDEEYSLLWSRKTK